MDGRFTDVASALDENNAAEAVKKIQEHLEKVKQIPITIAVTGESGAGKSTLVNALRGVDDTAPDAAPTGCVETTMAPTKYPHPNFPNITIWDLPGIGTTRMKADQYLEHVGFQKYDFFLLVSDTRFREHDADLALEIQKMEKKFYFLRSKIDHNVRDEKRKGRSENETLEKIRENCEKELQQLDVESPKIFLVSSVDILLYDFPILMETLQTEMPQHQRDALLLAVPSYNENLIQKKKEMLEARIPGYQFLAVLGTISTFIPLFLPLLLNVFANECKEAFGLTEESLVKLSEASQVPLDDLKAVTRSCKLRIMKGVLGETPLNKLLELLNPIPFFAPIGFKRTLDRMAEEAQRVFKKAIGLEQ